MVQANIAIDLPGAWRTDPSGNNRPHDFAMTAGIMRSTTMSDTKGKGSQTARRANAAAAKEGESNPRKCSRAQAILGKKGGRSSS